MQLFNVTKAVVWVPSLHLRVPPGGTVEVSEEAYTAIKELVRGVLSSEGTSKTTLVTSLPSTVRFNMLERGTKDWTPNNDLTLEQKLLFHRVAKRAFFRRME